jgi:VanZ family protein
MGKIIRRLLLFIWISFIFINSMQTGTQSSEVSGWISETFSQVLNFLRIRIGEEDISLIVRKGAHVFEFFILALLFSENYFLRFPLNKVLEYTIISCIAIAITDEIIQLFVEGRAGMLVDVAIDNVGAVFGSLLFYLIKKNKQKNPQTPLNNSHET